jgi:hypothetical protein
MSLTWRDCLDSEKCRVSSGKRKRFQRKAANPPSLKLRRTLVAEVRKVGLM